MKSQYGEMTRVYATAGVYLAGAAIYFLVVEVFGANFLITPLFIGGIMLVASVVRPRLLASAIVLAAWGVAVLLVDHGVLASGRATPSYMAAFGVAALILLALRRWFAAEVALESIAVIMLVGGIALYAAYDQPAFGRGWLWALALALNAIGLVLAAWWRARSRPISEQQTSAV